MCASFLFRTKKSCFANGLRILPEVSITRGEKIDITKSEYTRGEKKDRHQKRGLKVHSSKRVGLVPSVLTFPPIATL